MKRRNFLGSVIAALGSLAWPSWLFRKPAKTVFCMKRFDYHDCRPTKDRMYLDLWQVWQFGKIKDRRAIRAAVNAMSEPGDEIIIDGIEMIEAKESRRLGVVERYRKSIDGQWITLPVDDA